MVNHRKNIDGEYNLLYVTCSIQELHEKEQLLQSTIALSCRWKYETLVWNTSKYGGIKRIKVSPRDAWIPDLTVSNSVDALFLLTETNDNMNRITVTSNGDATWYPGGNVLTACHMDIIKYPFDTQTCNIIIGKLEFDSEVYITSNNVNAISEMYEENGEWMLKSAIVEQRLLYHDVTNLYIKLTLSRHSFFYILNVILPVVLLSFMMVLSFKIPPDSGERLGYNIALLLTFVVLLNLIGESMPRVSKHVSYLQLYVNYQLTIAMVVTALSVLFVNFAHTRNEANLPVIVKLCYKCCRKRNKAVNFTNLEEVSKTGKTEAVLDGVMKAESISCSETDLLVDKEIVLQHIGNTLSWVFATMFITSTILFFIVVLI
ncbi:acetylcholine receptor subunit beta-like [Mercenaria mercenaria]|uniref:acetylcholine receptor subunit beta-like n=1 Tax=Mercenaria mercenaria TaxID=6596 RepID=UPI00234EC007|nr:acetylcholine receptor subunit beta-like [Mercenaria mercenaria]